MPSYHRIPRVNQLMKLDEQIRVAMLGEAETRWDLMQLRGKVRTEIKREIEANGGNQFIRVD